VSRLVDAGLPLYPDRWDGPLIRRDPRLESVAGSDISIESHFWLARDLTVGWLASLRCPPLKAVAVDLDNTLYHGVLGEVGHAGVEFTGDHVSLLDALGRLARQGVLICVVTRNDQRDLAALAQVWPQGGFTLDGAAIVSASWEDKATVIQRMAADLATEPSSMMFVDDNPGELVRAISGNPGLWPVLADSPTQVVALLETQRHRASSSSDTTGGARAADARALEERSRHADASHSMQDLHERLRTRISARVATQDDVPRVEDMLKRTNQFNLTLRRTGVKDIDDARRRPDREVLVAAVSDDLSDSGLVAVMIVTLSERRLEIDELAISCRVLGRDLETALVVSMLDCLELDAAGLELLVPVVHGPRNEPALIWLSTVAAAGIDGLATASVDAQDLRTLSSDILSVVAGPEAVGRDDA
jgi:FkbH-like protein